MQSLVRAACERPIAIAVFALLISALGVVAWRQMPVELLPTLKSPSVTVMVRSGDRPVEHMERWFGERIERRLFTVQGLVSIRQTAFNGKLVSRLLFDGDTDVDLALVDVNRALASLAADPMVDELRVRRDDHSQRPVAVLGMVGKAGDLSLVELSSLARRQVARYLERLDGVAEVRVSGGREREVQIVLDPVRMRAFDITVNDVSSGIAASNIDFDVGTLEDDGQVLLIRADTRYSDLSDVRDAVIRYAASAGGQTAAVRVADVARVEHGPAQMRSSVRVNGREGVGLFVYKASGANTVAVSKRVHAALDELARDLPHVHLARISDEATQIRSAIRSVGLAAVFGVFLAVTVLVAFLRQAGPVFCAAVAMPVSLLATTLAMNLAGQSLNVMTLGGLALGAGMLVDNAIVVIESIFRCRAAGDGPIVAAVNGTRRVGDALVTSTVSTCIVFLPVVFVDGLAARLLSGISFTVVVSLLVSLVVALVLIPTLSVSLIDRPRVAPSASGTSRFERLVLRLLSVPRTVCIAALALVAASIVVIAQLGTQLLPPAHPDHFSLRVTGPAGQRIESTIDTVAQVERVLTLAADDQLAGVLSEVGQLDDDDRIIREHFTGENTAEVYVRIAGGGPSSRDVVDRAVAPLAALYGLDIEWRVADTAFAQAMGSSGPDTVIEIRGESLDDLRTAAASIAERLQQDDSLRNVRTSFEGAPDEVRLRLKRELADGLGIRFETIVPVLEAALGGLTASELVQGDEVNGILVALPAANARDIERLAFVAPGGQRLTIGDVVDVRVEPGARKILRRDQSRIAEVSAMAAVDRSAPEIRATVAQTLAASELPDGVQARLAGEERERAKTMTDLGWILLLALALVFLVLAASFESLIHPVTILSAIPMAVPGVAAVAFALQRPLGVMTALGFVILIGVAVNNAVLLVTTARRRIRAGESRVAALAKSAQVRLRPIAMTTATTVLALLPLVLIGGGAAQIRSPLAWSIMGGLLSATLGCLLVIPCAYLVLDNVGRRLARRGSRVAQPAAGVALEDAGRA